MGLFISLVKSSLNRPILLGFPVLFDLKNVSLTALSKGCVAIGARGVSFPEINKKPNATK